jgi:hypothetical protein
VQRLESQLIATFDCIRDRDMGGTPIEKICGILKTAIEDTNTLSKLVRGRGEDPEMIRVLAELRDALTEHLELERTNLESPTGEKKVVVNLNTIEALKMIYTEIMARTLDVNEYIAYRNGKEMVRQMARIEGGEDPNSALPIINGEIVETKQNNPSLN